MKKMFFIITLILINLFYLQAQNNQIIAYYPFNGNANDESGNGNNGTALNGVQITKVATFDGVDDEISINATQELQDVTGGNHTFSVWVKLASEPTVPKFVLDLAGGGDQHGLRFEGSSRPVFKWITSNGSYRATSSEAITVGEWHHIVGILVYWTHPK